MSVGTGVALLPPTGLYDNGTEFYEVHHSSRGHWYAMRMDPDGSATYVAQDVDLSALVPSGTDQRQRCTACAEPGIYNSGLCKRHERQRVVDSWGFTARQGI
jgi:hypothetical protein